MKRARFYPAFEGKGFTLVELLVVVTILAILGVIGTVLFTSLLDRTRVTAATTTMKQLSRALMKYKVFAGQFPPLYTGPGTGDLWTFGTADSEARATLFKNNTLNVLASTADGGPYIDQVNDFAYDPWGNAYYFDDNDLYAGGTNACQGAHTWLCSGGPNKTWDGGFSASSGTDDFCIKIGCLPP